METLIVNLGSYSDKNIGILAGRERGATVRKAVGLDEADVSGRRVRIVIPAEIYSVNSSFFLGMFETSILTLGADEFIRRYEFVGVDANSTRDEGIRTALLARSPLIDAKRRG